MDSRIVSRAEAKRLGLNRYFTGIACKRGHIAARLVSICSCVECERERGAVRCKVEPNQLSEARSERGKRTGATRARSRRVRAENPKKQNQHVSAWRKRNPHKNAATASKRRADKLDRTPPWLTKEDKAAIKSKYAEARWMTARTGIKHHVDHIVPLRGKLVSGLHVPWNLRVITAKQNAKKGNCLT